MSLGPQLIQKPKGLEKSSSIFFHRQTNNSMVRAAVLHCVDAPPPQPSLLAFTTCSVLSLSVWAEQHLSSGIFEFGSLRIARDTGEGREAGRGRVALALHKHRVQACNFGSKESMNTVEHRKEVGELQLLENRNKVRGEKKLVCLGVPANRSKLARAHPNTDKANKQFLFSFSKFARRVLVQDFFELSQRHAAARVSVLWLIQISGTIYLKISKWLRPLTT